MLQKMRARLAMYIAAGGRKLVAACNAVTNVGYHVGGRFSATASGAVSDKDLVKLTSPGVAAVNDGVPCGVAMHDAADGDELGIQALGGADRTVVVRASAAVTLPAILVADGVKVKTLPTAPGTYYIVGGALTAAAGDGDELGMAPCAPVKIVVS
jgi:hypothetical protein